jgi:LysM repeat protein
MPTLPFPEHTAASVVESAPAEVAPVATGSTEGFFESIAASIEGSTARALHPATAPSVSGRVVSPTDPTVEFDRPVLTGLAGHGRLAGELAPWNRTAPLERSVRHLHVVRDVLTSSGVSDRSDDGADDVVIEASVRTRAVGGSMRSIVGGVILALVIALAAIGALQFFGAAAAATTPAATTEPSVPTDTGSVVASAPIATPAPTPHSIVVQRGDSIWTVARRVQPTGDLRGLVDALIERNGGVTIEAGQRLDLTGLVD